MWGHFLNIYSIFCVLLPLLKEHPIQTCKKATSMSSSKMVELSFTTMKTIFKYRTELIGYMMEIQNKDQIRTAAPLCKNLVMWKWLVKILCFSFNSSTKEYQILIHCIISSRKEKPIHSNLKTPAVLWVCLLYTSRCV